ncbi:MAG: hypothetical protein WHV66_04105 [Anaerolineales bacterium]
MSEINDLLDLVISDVEAGEGRPAVWMVKNGARMIRPVIRSTQRPPRWTPEEDEFLRSNSTIMSVSRIADHLGRSISAVLVRQKRIGAISPRRAPGYISCNKIAKILGVDSHKPPTWVDLGILKGEPIPYDYGTLKRRVKIEDFKRWLIKPTSWVYFDVKRIRIKSFRRLVELAQQRWGDEWWTTRQAADYLGTTTNLVLQQIKRGRINGFQAIGLDRIRNPRWAFWFVRRSEILKYRMPNRSDSNNFTPSADEFMLKARIEWGLSPAVIAKMMKRDKRSVENRIRFLCRQRGIVVKKLTGKTERAEKKHTCKVCGAVFKSRGRYAFYCTNCRLEKRKNREACKS